MNNENNGYHNEKGRFALNNPGKPRGSTKNKLRDRIKTFLNDNFDNLPAWFEGLKPKEKIDCYLALMPYGVSRLQSISMTDNEGNDIEPKAVIHWTKLDQETLSKVLSVTETNEEYEHTK